jgi:hypothetical protein
VDLLRDKVTEVITAVSRVVDDMMVMRKEVLPHRRDMVHRAEAAADQATAIPPAMVVRHRRRRHSVTATTTA